MSTITEVLAEVRAEAKKAARYDAFVEWLGEAKSLEVRLEELRDEQEKRTANVQKLTEAADALQAEIDAGPGKIAKAKADVEAILAGAHAEAAKIRAAAEKEHTEAHGEALTLVQKANADAKKIIQDVNASTNAEQKHLSDLKAQVAEAAKELTRVQGQIKAFVASLPKVA